MAEQEKINLVVSGLLQQLSVVYQECERRLVCIEAVCSDTSELLKPWPRKEPQEKTKDSTQTRQQVGGVTGGDTVPVEELAELRVLDRVLSKARKVRSKYLDKLKEVQNAETPEGATEEDVQGQQANDLSDHSKPTDFVQITEPQKTNRRPLKGKDGPGVAELHKRGVTAYSTGVKVKLKSASRKGESIGIVSQSTLNRLLQKPCPASAPQKPSQPPNPPSRHFTPAHASAPYRTDPGHQRRSKVTRGGVRSRPHDTPSTVEICTTATSLRGDVSSSVTDDTSVSHMLVTDDTSVSHMLVTDDTSVSHRRQLTEEWLQQSVVSESLCGGQCAQVTTECGHQTAVTAASVCAIVDSGRLRKCESESRRGGCLPVAPQAGGDGATGREKSFLLQRDGHCVSVPRSLVRAASTNWRLRVKVQRAAVVSRVSGSRTQSAAAQFTDQLHNYMTEGLSDDLFRLLQQLHALCDVYDALSTTLQTSLAPRLHDGSSWQEVLRCQKTVELVFTLFDDLEEGYSRIKANVQHVSVKEMSDMKQPRDIVNCRRCPSVWLPQQLHSTRQDLPTLLRYKHKKQLSRYTTQLHTAQLLQLCRYTMTAVERELLPVLQQMDTDHPCHLALYRTVYALLCTQGRRFPVMVQDLPDTDTQSEDINDF